MYHLGSYIFQLILDFGRKNFQNKVIVKFLRIVCIVFINTLISLIIPKVTFATDGNTFFFDDFSSETLSNWTKESGNWYINTSGNLVGFKSGTFSEGTLKVGTSQWKNYRLELDVNGFEGIDQSIGFRYTQNGNYGINLRYDNGTGYYNTPQIKFWRNTNNSSDVPLINSSFPLINNRWYHLKIELFNENIKVWIENTLLFNFTDPETTIKSGPIILNYWTGSVGIANMGFDNVKVTDLGPNPFLDLPWDYEEQDSTFNYMALNPYSWFDHQYPLQNKCCNWQVMDYTGETIQVPYRSHNGYDYSRKNGIILNTPVLASATGTATFKPWNKSGGAGNVIKIDHGNGYQTWYEHLSGEGLIVSTEGQEAEVEQGDQIGLVGMTGNTDGPHIHFSVFKDSNYNNSFSDEIPYGVTDPLGWEGTATDPWSFWNNGARSGTSSYNLFSPASFTKSVIIPVGGGTLTTEDTTISVPAGAYNGSFKLIHNIGPFVSLPDYVTGITPSFSLNAYNNGQSINQFSKPITITINYSKANLTNIKENTIKFRYFNEQSKVWEELPTTIDTVNKTITTEINHLSRFAVTGDTKDLITPTTTFTLTGEQGEDGWYRTPLEIKLSGNDNGDGVGLEYTLYTLNGEDWFEYSQPLVFDTEGAYQIIYQSYDRAENQEQRKTLNFHIDKTPPSVTLDANPKTLWPPNGKIVDISLAGTFSDNQPKGKIVIEDEYNPSNPLIYEFEGPNINQPIKLEARREGNDIDGRKYLVKVTDLAGNIGGQLEILVPHDQKKL